MNIALIDNDYTFNEVFNDEMKPFDFSYRYFSSYDEFKKELNLGYTVDILLLDIEMPNKNGFEIAKELEMTKPNIGIFYITEHMELIYDSFGSNICGFFPKIYLQNQPDLLVRRINESYNQNNSLFIKTGKETQRIRFINISYIEKIKKNVVLYTINNETIMTKFNYLHELESLLPSSLFFYINRSVIVNIKQVKSLGDTYLIMMDKDKKLDISRGKYKEVKEAIALL